MRGQAGACSVGGGGGHSDTRAEPRRSGRGVSGAGEGKEAPPGPATGHRSLRPAEPGPCPPCTWTRLQRHGGRSRFASRRVLVSPGQTFEGGPAGSHPRAHPDGGSGPHTFVWASWSAPCLVRTSATCTLSSWAARCKAVSPLCREKGPRGRQSENRRGVTPDIASPEKSLRTHSLSPETASRETATPHPGQSLCPSALSASTFSTLGITSWSEALPRLREPAARPPPGHPVRAPAEPRSPPPPGRSAALSSGKRHTGVTM